MTTFANRLNAGDLDGLVALYEDVAVFEPGPGILVRGKTAIRRALEGLLTLEPTITSQVEQIMAADDLALVVNRWSLTGTGPDGEEVRRSGSSADVLRRQADGRWLVVVDKP